MADNSPSPKPTPGEKMRFNARNPAQSRNRQRIHREIQETDENVTELLVNERCSNCISRDERCIYARGIFRNRWKCSKCIFRAAVCSLTPARPRPSRALGTGGNTGIDRREPAIEGDRLQGRRVDGAAMSPPSVNDGASASILGSKRQLSPSAPDRTTLEQKSTKAIIIDLGSDSDDSNEGGLEAGKLPWGEQTKVGQRKDPTYANIGNVPSPKAVEQSEPHHGRKDGLPSDPTAVANRWIQRTAPALPTASVPRTQIGPQAPSAMPPKSHSAFQQRKGDGALSGGFSYSRVQAAVWEQPPVLAQLQPQLQLQQPPQLQISRVSNVSLAQRPSVPGHQSAGHLQASLSRNTTSALTRGAPRASQDARLITPAAAALASRAKTVQPNVPAHPPANPGDRPNTFCIDNVIRMLEILGHAVEDLDRRLIAVEKRERKKDAKTTARIEGLEEEIADLKRVHETFKEGDAKMKSATDARRGPQTQLEECAADRRRDGQDDAEQGNSEPENVGQESAGQESTGQEDSEPENAEEEVNGENTRED